MKNLQTGKKDTYIQQNWVWNYEKHSRKTGKMRFQENVSYIQIDYSKKRSCLKILQNYKVVGFCFPLYYFLLFVYLFSPENFTGSWGCNELTQYKLNWDLSSFQFPDPRLNYDSSQDLICQKETVVDSFPFPALSSWFQLSILLEQITAAIVLLANLCLTLFRPHGL